MLLKYQLAISILVALVRSDKSWSRMLTSLNEGRTCDRNWSNKGCDRINNKCDWRTAKCACEITEWKYVE